MSDPVTNVEIEDVLSSIRRLVSNESRTGATDPRGGAPRTDEQPEKAADAPGAPKLVLTPSFRVDESQRGDPPLPDAALSGPAPQPAVEEEAEVQGGAKPDHQSEETEDAPDEDLADVNHSEDDEADADAFEETGEGLRDNLDADGDQDDGATAGIANALRDRVAEMEQAVAERSEQWEPDGASNDDYAGGSVEPLPWEDYVPSETGGDADGNTQSDVTEGVASDAAAEADAGQSRDEKPVGESADETAGAEAVAATGESPARDTADSQETAQAEPFADHEASMPEAAQAEDRLDDDTADLLDLDDDADAILDEDALRELVTEIVRQELQGGLGERITRNVRKLVRREIHRALASQELE